MTTLNISKYHSPKAGEMFSAGWCNLKCSYCYIPKDNEFLMGFHKKIREGIKDGSTLCKFHELYGDNLTSFSHWGTEPTLTLLDHIPKFYTEALKLFPKLDTIAFSSNYMVGGDIIPTFIKNFPKTDRTIKFDLQISIDGPKWLTDNNRGEGSTEKIIKNSIETIKKINEIENVNGTKFKVRMHVKPTAVIGDIKRFAYNFSVLESYYRFFDRLFCNYRGANSNNKIDFMYNCDPTIVVPYDFTQEDGFAMSKLFDSQLILSSEYKFNLLKPSSAYYNRFMSKIPAMGEWYTKNFMFSCSAGDGGFSLDEKHNVVPCHRVFYITSHNYIETSKKCVGDLIRIDESTVKNLSENYSGDSNDQLDIDRLLLINRGYHDFSKFKECYGVSTIQLMAQHGQVSKVYKNFELARLLSYFVTSCIACPMENISTGGSIFIQHSSLFKLFGNGFFEKVLRKYINEGR